MKNYNLPSDASFWRAAGFEIDGSPGEVMAGQIDENTGRILVDLDGDIGLTVDNFKTETFTSTNGQTTFPASFSIDFDQGMYVNGSRQFPSGDYSIVGQAFVLNSGIPAGCAVIVSYITLNP